MGVSSRLRYRSLRLARAWLFAGAAALSACSQLPSAGPTAHALIGQATENGVAQFQLVDLSANVVDRLQSQPVTSFQSAFGRDGMPPEPTISVGDAVSLSIWEAGGTGLFEQSMTVNGIPTGSRPATIPAQIVPRDGTIDMPFVGRIAVVGRMPEDLDAEIERRLQGKASSPQVLVTVERSIANAVTVSGEAVGGARVPLSSYGMRMLDVIAAAGGAHASIYETFVKLSRRGTTVTLPLASLVDDPAQNIYAWPGDILTLVHAPKHFEAFGATGRNAEIPLDAETVSLAQALAKSAGLLDERSDPAGIFLFRFEPPALVQDLTGGTPAPKDEENMVPVVYHLDLSEVKSYFVAQRFQIEDKDIIYVANAGANELEKFLNLLGELTQPITTGVITTNAAQ